MILNSRIYFAIVTASVFYVAESAAVPVEYFDHGAFASSAGGLTVVNFDTFSSGTILGGNKYQTLGLTIVNNDVGQMRVFDPTITPFYFETNRNSASNIFGGAELGSENFDFVFDAPVSDADLWLSNISPGVTMIELLDADNNVIASEVIDNAHAGIISRGQAAWDNRLFYGLITDTPLISAIRTVEALGDSDGIGYDDVQFSAQSIPEPSTLLLLGTDLVGLVGYGRRKRRAQSPQRSKRTAPFETHTGE